MIRLVATAVIAAVLAGCQATTPLLIAEMAGHQAARYDEDIKVRFAASIQDEPDLLTYSAQAISQNKTDEAIDTYLKGYQDKEYNTNMKSLAIYQIALIHMSRFSDKRDDVKALEYLERHLKEFPESRLRPKIVQHIEIINTRRAEPVQLTATQLVKRVDRAALLKIDDTPFDFELNGMSERAITQGRTADAETVYLILYSNTASSDEMRAKALYQLGLIYMSPFNDEGNNQKALTYFRKITNEFPNSSVRKNADKRISQLINLQD